jgi:hypothetical protein
LCHTQHVCLVERRRQYLERVETNATIDGHRWLAQQPDLLTWHVSMGCNSVLIRSLGATYRVAGEELWYWMYTELQELALHTKQDVEATFIAEFR